MDSDEIWNLVPGENVYYMTNKDWAERAFSDEEKSIELLIKEAYFGTHITEGPNVGLHFYLTDSENKQYDAFYHHWDPIQGLMCEYLDTDFVLSPQQFSGLKIWGHFKGPELIGLRTYVDPTKED